MKKLLFSTVVLLLSGMVMAQGSKGKMITNKSFLVLHGGPSLTTGHFASNNFDNTLSGFANTGFNINLNYGYRFTKIVGITGSVFYSRYNLDKDGIAHIDPAVNADHWQYYGISAGPILSHEFSKKVTGDLYVMGGASSANSPEITYENLLTVNGTWVWTGMLRAGVDLRFDVGKNIFIHTNADYTYMQPEFKLKNSSGFIVEGRHHQTISVVNLTGGIGIKF